MKITKYEHACLVIEEAGKKLVVDPGTFSQSLPIDFYDIVVITHVHGDHLDPPRLKSLLAKSPNLAIYSVNEVASELKKEGIEAIVVTAGQKLNVAGFDIEFFGGQHAVIHNSYPPTQNIAVLINNALYYPGDSFTVPEGISVQILALPTSAPWLKIGEVMDFLTAVKPKTAFPTHNALNSELGESLVDQMIGGLAKSQNTTYKYLAVGESLEI